MSHEYDSDDDVRKSFEAAYEAIRERMKNGGPGWIPKVKYDMPSQSTGNMTGQRLNKS